MQTNITALDLLNPTARASYEKLTSPAAASPASPAGASSTAPDPMAMARDAIAQGAPPAAVAKRLRDNGIDPSRLLTGTPQDLGRTPGQD